MHARSHRKQVLLFLIAVILPSVLLVALTLRMIGQESELAQQRRAEERRRLGRNIGQQLLVRLKTIKLEEARALENRPRESQAGRYMNSEVVLVGAVEQDRLVLPWDRQRNDDPERRVAGADAFARKVEQGEREEFIHNRPASAVELYREAMSLAPDTAGLGYARLLLARALAKSGRRREARQHYRSILSLPSAVRDEHDIPLALYAAGRLLEGKTDQRPVLERIAAELEPRPLLSPTESYMLRGLAETLVAAGSDSTLREAAQRIHQRLRGHLANVDQALALQRDFPNLMLVAGPGSSSPERDPLWIAYGEDPWLVSLGSSLTGSQALAFAVHAESILASLASETRLANALPGEIHFVTDRRATGASLGPDFEGLQVTFTVDEGVAPSGVWNRAGSLYLVTLLLVLSVTLFGAYLLWLDVRRELRLAEMRSQFVSSVSHELKTPLTAIRMFGETLRLGRCASPQDQAEYVETIVSESERLTRLLNNVLDFSKIEQGKKIYRPKPTSLIEIVRSAARTMQYPLAQQGFDLRVEVSNGLAPLRVDRDAVEQAILNLLANAVKYSGDSRTIELGLKQENGHAVIHVRDHGIGIDPKQQARIFEKFYRTPSAENQSIPGTGLGLALVAHIAQAHGGRVDVESVAGKGSTFSIHLPMDSEP